MADEVKRIDFEQYMRQTTALRAACESKGSPSFTGFCFSQPYGQVSLDNPTQTSITMGLELAALEYFYGTCEHSELPTAQGKLTRAKRVLDAEKFFNEARGQTEALKNYVGRHQPCRTREANDRAIMGRLDWLDGMAQRYSAAQPVRASVQGRDRSVAASTLYAGRATVERVALECDGPPAVDTACVLNVGAPANRLAVRFTAQPTSYHHLLQEAVEKAAAAGPNSLSPSALAVLPNLDLSRCHPAADSEAVSGDLLQLCLPSDRTKVVLFMRGLCDRCAFEPVILEKQDSGASDPGR